MTASKEVVCYLVWPLPETAMGILCNCLVGDLPHTRYTLRDTTIPFVRKSGSPPRTNDLTRPPSVVTAENKNIRSSTQVTAARVDLEFAV